MYAHKMSSIFSKLKLVYNCLVWSESENLENI